MTIQKSIKYEKVFYVTATFMFSRGLRHYGVLTSNKLLAAINALTGMVKIHAINSFCVTPQRTADKRFTDPTPIMAPVIVWCLPEFSKFSKIKR